MVLSLSHFNNITEVPDSLGNLTNLRYLDLSNTKIERLPDTTYKLQNLQTLLLSKCWLLTELPKKIGNLVNLFNLDISGTKLKEMPVQIAGLKNLQTLSNFVVSKQQDGLKCSSWQSLLCLESLSIYACLKLETVPDSGSLVTPNLNNFLVSTCGKLKSLPKPINALSRLYQMSVYGISNLLAFVEGGFPVHLRTLEIS
ncbi:putative disease resistance RPP13-like protein 1 [Glycine max]|nr:putative disease resistance RPP13-like protein 1 [Glycine max]